MTECFWCDAVYDNTQLKRCPKCLSDTNTKEIKIISQATSKGAKHRAQPTPKTRTSLRRWRQRLERAIWEFIHD
jgi:hypothetical protein